MKISNIQEFETNVNIGDVIYQITTYNGKLYRVCAHRISGINKVGYEYFFEGISLPIKIKPHIPFHKFFSDAFRGGRVLYTTKDEADRDFVEALKNNYSEYEYENPDFGKVRPISSDIL